jgi:type IV pilus assembly protein PilX
MMTKAALQSWSPRRRDKESGFVLITALIFLVVLTTIAMMSLRGSILEEKISGNQRDQILAQEAAEMALRDAELDIRGLRFDNVFCGPSAIPASTCGGNKRPAGTRPLDENEAGNFWIAGNPAIADAMLSSPTADARPSTIDGSNIGIYDGTLSRTSCGKSIWSAADWDSDTPPTANRCNDASTSIARTVIYGSFTGAPSGADVFPTGTRLPRYLIEVFKAQDLGIPNSNKIFFRATAVGFGRTTRDDATLTSVTLQSVFSVL